MTRTDADTILRHIHKLVDAPGLADTSDRQLLDQYLLARDEAAFTALLHRHGPMVLDVCRRVLRQTQDAEDVFQATFLLLARKAGAIRKRESVGCWLHGVAYRIALKARRQADQRRLRERQAVVASRAEVPAVAAWRELQAMLDTELGLLPERYRTPLVLCYLEGKTQEEAAGEIGCALGTVRSRVARGRALLQKRLIRRGLTLSGPALATALTAHAATAAVPAGLLSETVGVAGQLTAGHGLAGVASAAVTGLVREGLRSLLIARVKPLGVLCLTVGLVAGAALLASAPRGGKPSPPAVAAGPASVARSEQPARTDRFGDPLPAGAVGRLGTVRFRHEAWVGPFVLSPDDQTLAVAAGRSVSCWDMATGRLRGRLVLPGAAECAAFAPDGRLAAVGCADGSVRLFDPATGKEVRRLLGHQPEPGLFRGAIADVAFSRDGRTLTTRGGDKTTRVWETASGKELRQLGKGRGALAVSPDGRLEVLPLAGDTKTLRLWDVPADREVRRLTHDDEVGRMAFSADGKTLAVAVGTLERPCQIVLWEVASGKRTATLTGHTAQAFCLAFAPDGRTLASGGYDDTVRLWDLASGKERHPAHHLHTPIYQAQFTRNGKTLIARGAENRVRLWDTASWRELPPADGPNDWVQALAFSPDGRFLASGSGRTVWLWDAVTGQALRQLDGHRGYQPSVAFAPDSKSLVSGNAGGTIRAWDPESGRELRRFKGPVEGFAGVVLSPDGRMLAVWGDSQPQVIHLCQADTGKELRRLDIPAERAGVRATIQSLCFALDSKTLFAGSGTHLGILHWDVATGESLAPLGKHDGGLNGIALAPDGRSIAAVTMAGTLYLWETATRQVRLITKQGGYATAVAFSPDGKLLAVANNGMHRTLKGDQVIYDDANREEVCLLDAGTGQVLRRFAGHLGGVASLAFAPDGRTLASGGADTTVLLWSTAVRKPATHLGADDLEARWADLRGDAERSYRGMAVLAAAPAQTVRVFRDRLKPVAVPDAGRVAGLVKRLNSEQFAEREDATRELTGLGEAAEPVIRKVLDGAPPIEVRRRVERILTTLGSSEERLRSRRAIEVLERIGDPASRSLLRRLAEGALGAWLTQEASQSLERLERRRP